jgi:hypothetical protein
MFCAFNVAFFHFSACGFVPQINLGFLSSVFNYIYLDLFSLVAIEALYLYFLKRDYFLQSIVFIISLHVSLCNETLSTILPLYFPYEYLLQCIFVNILMYRGRN